MRLFVGVPVPPLRPLLEAGQRLKTAVPEARLVAPPKFHVTLRFLGEVPQAGEVEARLRTALADCQATVGQAGGVGGFPDASRARVAWAAIESPGLMELATRVRHATGELGQPETHPFVGHVTLARLPRPRDLAPWIRRHALPPPAPGSFAIESVVLYESRTGDTYRAVATFPLQPRTPSPLASSGTP